MSSKHKNLGVSVDDLLREQEKPIRKKRRISDDTDSEDPQSPFSECSTSASAGRGDSTGIPDLKFDREESSDSEEGTSSHRLAVEGRIARFFKSSAEKGDDPGDLGTRSSSRATFSSLGVSTPLVTALNGMAIKMPTQVQEACIPPLLSGMLFSSTASSNHFF